MQLHFQFIFYSSQPHFKLKTKQLK